MAVPDLRTKARDAFRRRNYDLAVEMYLEALRFDPNDPETLEGFFVAATKARETKGKALFGGMMGKVGIGASRDPRKRVQACFRGLAKSPNSKSLLLSLGSAAGEMGAEETAVGAYKRATEVDAEDATAWKYLGEFHGRRGRIREALDALNHAVRLAPKDQEAIKLRKNLAAEGALQTGRYDKAGSSRELMKDQDEARRLEAESRMQLTTEHAAREETQLRAMIEKEPDNVRTHIRLAEMLLHQGEEERALEAFDAARRIAPDNYDLSVRVGDMELRRIQRVAKDAKDAWDAAPDDAAKKAVYEQAARDFLHAQKKEYLRRVDSHPLDLKERFRLGRTLLALGEIDEAAAEFQQTVRDPKRKTESLLLLARCFEQKKLISLALKKVEEAMEDFPSPTSPQAKDVHYTYGALLERSDEKERARVVFEGIFEVDITYRDVSQRLEALTEG